MKLKDLEKEYKKGSILFREGDPGREIYIIRQGRVAIKKHMGTNEHLLAVLGSGDFFGEMAAFTGKPRSADAVIMENSKLLVVDPDTFGNVISGNPDIGLKIMRGLAGRVMEANKIIEGLLLKSDFARIVHFLLRLKGRKDGEVSLLTPLRLSKEIDIELPRVREVVVQLERAGIIKCNNDDTISVLNPEKLKNYMDFLLQMESEG